MNVWFSALRLRTLPLALSSIAMGGFLAAFYGTFKVDILLLSALTTVFLQILSNLANDYGDSVHGADHEDREGPQRAVQSGAISKKAMKSAVLLFVVLSLLSGSWLLYISFGVDNRLFILFFLLGVVAIAAAITYTAGARPYGYAGLGDLSVLIFFGIVGVLGSYYLYSQNIFHAGLMLPALSIGLFSVAVLNVNNIRDIESDKAAGKRSIPVRIGREAATVYHWILLGAGWLCALIFTISNYHSVFQFIYLVTLPLFIRNAVGIYKQESAGGLDPYLKQMAISTFLFVLLFGIGLVVSA